MKKGTLYPDPTFNSNPLFLALSITSFTLNVPNFRATIFGQKKSIVKFLAFITSTSTGSYIEILLFNPSLTFLLTQAFDENKFSFILLHNEYSTNEG